MRVTRLPLLAIFLLISGCTTSENSNADQMKPITTVERTLNKDQRIDWDIDDLSLNTYPVNRELQIAAVTPRLQYNYEEEEYALLSASRQISIYFGAYISYKKFIDENIIGTIQKQQIDVIYDQDLALTFMDHLKILATDRGLDYFSALIKTDKITLPDYPKIEIRPDEKPSWINNPPDLEGFIIGVGVSGRRKSVYESWEMADKLAMAEIANYISTNIKVVSATIERGGESHGASTSVFKQLTISDVHIKGLYILSRWRDPDNSYYYSLAITEKP